MRLVLAPQSQNLTQAAAAKVRPCSTITDWLLQLPALVVATLHTHDSSALHSLGFFLTALFFVFFVVVAVLDMDIVLHITSVDFLSLQGTGSPCHRP